MLPGCGRDESGYTAQGTGAPGRILYVENLMVPALCLVVGSGEERPVPWPAVPPVSLEGLEKGVLALTSLGCVTFEPEVPC